MYSNKLNPPCPRDKYCNLKQELKEKKLLMKNMTIFITTLLQIHRTKKKIISAKKSIFVESPTFFKS